MPESLAPLGPAQVRRLIWTQGLKLAQWARHACPCVAPEPMSRAAAVRLRVDTTLCIIYRGQRWSVMGMPGVSVGDLVHVWPAPQAGVLYGAAGNAAQPDTLVAWIDPAHSPQHMCTQCCTRKSWGSQTTCDAPVHQCSYPDLHADCKPQKPQDATSAEHMHSRTFHTAHAEPGADPIPTEQAVAPVWMGPLQCGTTGTHTEQASSGSSTTCFCCDVLYGTGSPDRIHP